jgi:hypothetical protein
MNTQTLTTKYTTELSFYKIMVQKEIQKSLSRGIEKDGLASPSEYAQLGEWIYQKLSQDYTNMLSEMPRSLDKIALRKEKREAQKMLEIVLCEIAETQIREI